VTDTPIVQSNILLGDTPIEVGSPEWFAWLDDPATKSFSYEKDSFTRFLARKRETKSGSGTWSAHKKVKGEVRVLGLGSTSGLTKEALESIVEEISTPDVDHWERFKATRSKPSLGQGLYKPAKEEKRITQRQDANSDELEKLRAELKSKDEALAQLQSQLKAVKIERNKLSQEATGLFKANQELGKDARESKALVDAYREQWQAEVNELVEKLEAKDKVITSLQSEKTQLQAQLAEYRTEASAPKPQWQRVGTITLTQKEMAERLGVKATTTLWRNHPRFPEYSQEKDPEGKAWQWDESAKAYYEVIQEGV
jgi:hypothetical protein